MTARIILLLALSCSEGWAGEPADRAEKARLHYAVGRDHVQRRRYQDAVREFEQGYELTPMPLFLYDIGCIAQLAGMQQKSLVAFERYLERAPDAPERAEVEQRIESLRHTLGVGPTTPVREPPSPAAPPPRSPPSPSAHASSQWLTATSTSATSAADRKRSPRSRRTLWIALGAVGGALVVGGVAIGAVLGSRSGSSVPHGFHDLGPVLVEGL